MKDAKTQDHETRVMRKDMADTPPKHDPSNRDPLSGEPGAHPVGTGVGAAGGAAAGAAIGTAAGGPVGAVVGAAVGGVLGALAGKGIAESVNPTVEDAFWREHYSRRPYYEKGRRYEDYQPAYRYGWESRAREERRPWREAESDLERGWGLARGESSMTWPQARPAVEDAWNRVAERAHVGERPGERDVEHSGDLSGERFGERFEGDADRYWQSVFSSRPYARDCTYEELQPAYRYGYESARMRSTDSWDDSERDLERGWDRARGSSRLSWPEAREAVRDAWQRVVVAVVHEEPAGARR
jgi:hypothetical protein